MEIKKHKIRYTFFDSDSEKFEILDVDHKGGNIYEIASLPEKSLGICKGDLIEAIQLDEDEPAEFIKFEKRSGDKLLSIDSSFRRSLNQSLMNQLRQLRCEIKETSKSTLVQINFQTDPHVIEEILETNNIEYQYLNPNPFEGKISIPL